MQRFIIFLLVGISFASCKKDEQCPAEDFIGTYMGDTECLLGLTSQMDDIVTVEKVSDTELVINFQNQSIPVDIEGCDTVVDDAVILGTGLEGEASWNGTELTVSYQVKALSVDVEDCTFVGTLQ